MLLQEKITNGGKRPRDGGEPLVALPKEVPAKLREAADLRRSKHGEPINLWEGREQ